VDQVDSMEFSEAVRGRRAIRQYRNQSIRDSEIQLLLDWARHAPSSMNGQPWHFVVIKDSSLKAGLAEIKNRYCPPEKSAFRADFLRQAPAIIVVCVEKARSFGREIENSLLAASIIMLASHTLGLATVYMSAYLADEPVLSQSIGELLRIPEGIVPISILPLGYPDEVPTPKELRPLKEMIHVDRF
jgi:nitroreductase